MKTRKRSLDRVPVVVDARTYGTEWVKWWMASQPKERDTQQWPLPRNPNGDVDWCRFPANGKDGLFIAVMALSWWAPAVQSPDDIAFFEAALTDLHWVVQELIRVKTTHQLLPSHTLPLQDEPNPHQTRSSDNQPNPTPRPPPSPSHPHGPPSHPPVSTPKSHTRQRAMGKRVVKLTLKAQTAI